MKISKTAVLAMWCVFATAGLWLMVATVVAGDESDKKDLLVDLSNAIQHIEKVTFISSWTDTSRATAQQVWGSDRLVWIKTNRFVLSESEKSNIIKNGKWLSILWWKWNTINSWAYNIILAWSGNKTEQWRYNTILGWEWNRIGAKSNSTIIGWSGNQVGWSNAVIVWWYNNETKWDKSVVVWNDSHITWTNSTALWLNSKINANSSFLWTDGKESDTLQADGVFAVVSQSGMVINTHKAHPLAQLTIWKPMIVYPSDKSKDIVCKGWKWWWIMKVMKNGESNQVCFCSCDGSWWNSLFEWRWSCLSVCKWNDYNPPKCGTEVKKLCIEGASNNTQFSWTCEVWEVLEWTGAYLVTSDNKVHWSCQTEDGSVNSSCSGEVNPVCENYYPEYTCEPGRYLPANKRVCEQCLCGSYCPWWTFTKKSTDQWISPCGDWEFSEEKSSSCESCPEWKFPTSNHCGCMEKITCEAGTYLPANSIECDPCLCGSYCEWWTFTKKSKDQWISPCGDWNFSVAWSSDSSSCKACNWTVSSDKCNCEEIPPQDPECGTNAKTRYFQNKNTSTIRWYDNENDCKFWEESSPSFVDETTKKDLKWTCREWIKYETCYAHQQWCGDGEINGDDEECDLWSNNWSTSACCNASCKLKESCASPSCKNSLKIIANGWKVIINDDSPVISQTTLEQACNSTVKLTFQKQSEYKTNCTTTFHWNWGSATSSAETTEITKTTSYPFSGWSNSSTTTCGTWAAPYYTYPANSNGTTCTKTAQWKTIWTTSTSTWKITLPSAKRDGYTFLWWYTTTWTNAVRVWGAWDDYTPMACIPLYAHWQQSPQQCSNTLKVDPNGWQITFNWTTTTSATTATRQCGSGIYVPDPSRTNTTTGDCKVNFDWDWGNVSASSRTTTITKTTKYNFDAWSNSSTDTCGTWNPSTKMYTYPANRNGTTCTKTAQWKTGDTTTSTWEIILPTATRPGYDFLWWYTAKWPNGDLVWVAQGKYEPRACITLYAHWKEIPPTPCENTLKVNPNGWKVSLDWTPINWGSFGSTTKQCGSTSNIDTSSYIVTGTENCYVIFHKNDGTEASERMNAIITTTTKYYFNNWTNSSNCGKWEAPHYTHPATSGTICTKTAKWTTVTSYSTGSVSVPNVSRTDYIFLGWYTAANGWTLRISTGASPSYEPKTCETLYAQWRMAENGKCDESEMRWCMGNNDRAINTWVNTNSAGKTIWVHWDCEWKDSTAYWCKITCDEGKVFDLHNGTCVSQTSNEPICSGWYNPLPEDAKQNPSKYRYNLILDFNEEGIYDGENDWYYVDNDEWEDYENMSCMWTCADGYHINDDYTECVLDNDYMCWEITKNGYKDNRYMNDNGWNTSAACKMWGYYVNNSAHISRIGCNSPSVTRECTNGSLTQECGRPAKHADISVRFDANNQSNRPDRLWNRIWWTLSIQQSMCDWAPCAQARSVHIRVGFTLYTSQYNPAWDYLSDSSLERCDFYISPEDKSYLSYEIVAPNYSQPGIGNHHGEEVYSNPTTQPNPNLRVAVCNTLQLENSSIKKVQIISDEAESHEWTLHASKETVFISNYTSAQPSCDSEIRTLYCWWWVRCDE